MWKIYILHSEKIQRTYVGCCHDIEERLRRHNSGQVKATKNGIPWKIIYQEEIPSYPVARKREKFYKSGAGRRKIAKIFELII